MSELRTDSAFGRDLYAVQLAMAGLICVGLSTTALAADHALSPQIGAFECSSVRPGDTITLAAGPRGPLTIRNCSATGANPITIRNDSRGAGPTIIRRTGGSAGGFVFACNSCVGVVIDGSHKWSGAPDDTSYGIKVTMTGGGAPSAFVRIGGTSRFVTIRNIEVDGAWPSIAKEGIGISVNDHSVKRNANAGLWREGILIEHSYVHNIEGEGMYVGPNYYDGDIPLRNIEIRYNLIEDTGWEGINTKSMWAGDNRIHHNIVRRTGKNGARLNKPTQYSAISNEAGRVKIYNNWIEKSGQHGIHQWTTDGPLASEGRGPFETYIWNNVIVDAGSLWQSFMSDSHGINVGARNGMEKPIVYVFNNTIVTARQSAVYFSQNVGGGYVRDNIIADTGESPIKAPSLIKQINNRIGPVGQMGFVSPESLDFRLSANSPARNQVSNEFPETDFDDNPRPQDGAADQGAFEFFTASSSAKPRAPGGLTVD